HSIDWFRAALFPEYEGTGKALPIKSGPFGSSQDQRTRTITEKRVDLMPDFEWDPAFWAMEQLQRHTEEIEKRIAEASDLSFCFPLPPPIVGPEDEEAYLQSREAQGHGGARRLLGVISRGTVGHPQACAEACKYAGKLEGCKLGENCPKCHYCVWSKRGCTSRKQRGLLLATTTSSTTPGQEVEGEGDHVNINKVLCEEDENAADGRNNNKFSCEDDASKEEGQEEQEKESSVAERTASNNSG
ncbi:unnamed protein product, partial [Amoebophrya sp. A25]